MSNGKVRTVALTPTQRKAMTIQEYLTTPARMKQLESALPKFLNAERFLRTCYTAVLRNPKLLDCSKESLLSAMIEAAQLGLEPILGKAALVPYDNKVTFQPMFRGLIDIALRSDKISNITAHGVYEKDYFKIEYGTEETLVHRPYFEGDRGEIIGAYTVWFFKDGTTTHLYMSKSDILKIRDRSPAWKAYKKKGKLCPWNTDEGEMMKKTVIKRHSKLQPCSVEFEQIVEYDNILERGEVKTLISKPSDIPPSPADELTEQLKNGVPSSDSPPPYTASEITEDHKEAPPETPAVGNGWYGYFLKARPGRSEKAFAEFETKVLEHLDDIYQLDSPHLTKIREKWENATDKPFPEGPKGAPEDQTPEPTPMSKEDFEKVVMLALPKLPPRIMTDICGSANGPEIIDKTRPEDRDMIASSLEAELDR